MVLFLKKRLFRPDYEVFLAKNQKCLNIGKIRQYDVEGVFFSRKKTYSSFKISSLPNWEGAKYAGGSRPSCYYFSRENLL